MRSLRPATVATTRAPPRRSAFPTALPIAPGLTIPTVAIAAESTALLSLEGERVAGPRLDCCVP